MALQNEENIPYDILELEQALNTAVLELKYERSLRAVENINRDEEVRQLKCQILLFEHDSEKLQEQLSEEERRVDELEESLQAAHITMDESSADVQRLSNELRAKNRELETMKTELNSLQNVSSDSTKILTEKLTLARELSTLKPELEHLRSQTASYQDTLSEKLALQRQVSTLEVQLENANRTVQRTLAKETEAKAQDSAQSDQIEELRSSLNKEKRERERMEKEAKKAETEWEAQRSILDDKLNQFRSKLKTTKDKLKETEGELQRAQVAAAAAASRIASTGGHGSNAAIPGRNGRKRAAAQMDPDLAIGTPGDGMAAKRGKRASSTVPGDKSTFSITPFLNRTSLAPESPPKDKVSTTAGGEDGNDEDTGGNTSSAVAKKPLKTVERASSNAKPKPLAPAASAKTNTKPSARRKGKAAVPALEKVAEEDDDRKEGATEAKSADNDQENAEPDAEPADSAPVTHQGPSKSIVMKAAPKALTSFASFNDSELQAEKKKKRKLPGNSSFLGKTLFDDEESNSQSNALGLGGFGPFGAQRAFGGYTARGLLGPGKGKAGLSGKGRLGALITAEDGFQFSPLKKDRKKSLAEEPTA